MTRITLGALTDIEMIDRRLQQKGLSHVESTRKADHFRRAAEALIQTGNANETPASAWYVPGRIELFGKHTDYAGGRSVTAAAERGFSAVAVERTDHRVSIIEVAGNQTIEFPFLSDLSPSIGHWSNYPMTVTRRIAQNFGEETNLRGASIAFLSDLPMASGMSSSSAFVISMLLLLGEINRLDQHPLYDENIKNDFDLAGYAASIENGQTFGDLRGDQGVGTFGGSEDHTAILNASTNQWGQYAYCPVRMERSFPMPPGFVLGIGSSGIVAEKTGAAMEKYNWATQTAARVAQTWRQTTGRDDLHIAAIVSHLNSTMKENGQSDAMERLRRVLLKSEHPQHGTQELLTRLDHFIAESENIIPQIPDRLDGDALDTLGRLADRSQRLAETQLGNQIPETVFLAKTARQLGASAASSFGAGFGGSVWALVASEESDTFLARWSDCYQEAFPRSAPNASYFSSNAGPAAFSL